MIVVEHIEPELYEWSICEYKAICALGVNVMLTNVANKQEFIEKIHPETHRVQYNSQSALNLALPNACLFDLRAQTTFAPEDSFDYWIIGGVLGDVPPKDRAGHLRAGNFEMRALGEYQLPTSTAAHIVKLIGVDKIPFEAIPLIKDPEFHSYENGSEETIEMTGFAYVQGENGTPMIPEGMHALLFKDLLED